MDWFIGIIVYLLTWWVMIFCILPIRIKSDKDLPKDMNPEEGWAGAPGVPMIKEKMIGTTIVSAIVWVIIYLLIDAEIINFHELAKQMVVEDYQ